jgi:hypothetical protein
MPDVRIKTPNLDDIFEKWKQQATKQALLTNSCCIQIFKSSFTKFFYLL